MIFPFGNRTNALVYLFLWIIYAVFHTLSMYQIIPISSAKLIVDGLIHAVLFGTFGILLWNVFQYGNYRSLPLYQQVINYSALAVLSIGLCVGLGFFFNYLFLGETFAFQLIPTLFLRSFIGLLLYLIFILYSHNKFLKTEPEQDEYMPQESPTTQEETNEDTREDTREDKLLEKENFERIAAKIGQKIHVIPISSILYFQSYGDYVQIITATEKLIKEQTMKYFESHLPSNQFVRIHRSYIVNIEMISRIELYTKQNQLVTLKNGDQLKVSAAGYKTLRAALDL